MDVPARFKWRKEKDRFAAYPSAKDHDERFMMIRLYNSGINTDATPHRPFESWHWLVRWDGWFVEHGFAQSKQAAADRATEAWWKWLQTEIPRDVELEVAMIAARVMIMPVPNSLFAEKATFLHSVLWHLKEMYSAEIKSDTVPSKAKNLIEQLSAELSRRREAGEETGEPKPYVPSHPVRRRRRR